MLSDRLQVNLQFDNLPCTIDVLFDYFFCFTSFNVSCSGAAFHAAKPQVNLQFDNLPCTIDVLFGYFMLL